MKNEDTDRDENPGQEGSEVEDRSRGFRLEAGLRPLSGLLGNLIEANVNEPPPPPEGTVEWETVDETEGDHYFQGEKPERKRTKRIRKSISDDQLFDTRFDDDKFIVIADIPGASKDNLSVGIDPVANTLIIAKKGTVLGRVELPWDSPETTKVWFNNGVLEVHLQSSSS